MDSDACKRVIAINLALAAGTVAPGSPGTPGTPGYYENLRKCNQWGAMLRMVREYYIRKIIPQPDPSPVKKIRDLSQFDLTRFLGDPDPEPMKDLILGELFLDNLRRGPTSTPSIFNDIIKSGAQIKIVEELTAQFEEGTKFLRMELEVLKKNQQ